MFTQSSPGRVNPVSILPSQGCRQPASCRQANRALINPVSILSGDPDASQLYVRMGFRDEHQMPTRGTEVIDAEGRDRIRAWLLEGPQEP